MKKYRPKQMIIEQIMDFFTTWGFLILVTLTLIFALYLFGVIHMPNNPDKVWDNKTLGNGSIPYHNFSFFQPNLTNSSWHITFINGGIVMKFDTGIGKQKNLTMYCGPAIANNYSYLNVITKDNIKKPYNIRKLCQ